MQEQVKKQDEYKFSRLMYIIEAALEYFVAIAVGGVYLAKLTSYMGIPDSVTGVLTAFVSLGCGFQIIAIFLSHKKPVKRWVTALHLISQTLFALLYFVPIFPLSTTQKTAVFVVIMLLSQILHNVVNAPKIHWYMSLVDFEKRGRFTANKEIVSLLGGMAFSYFMGALMDTYEAKGDMRTAFILGGITLLVLMILHTCTLVFAKEKKVEQTQKTSIKTELKAFFKDKTLFKIVLISVFWNIAHYITTPFMGTYQNNELEFTLKYASIIIMVGSFFRVLCSKPLGRFADKHSFTKMLIICYLIEAAAFGVNIFTNPSNGKVLYVIYHLLYVAGMAGINSAVINLIYDYVEEERRTGALAIQQTCAGFAGFFTTLVVSPLVKNIQDNGNTFLGIPVYAQQVLSAISFVAVLGLLVYMLTVIRKIKK